MKDSVSIRTILEDTWNMAIARQSGSDLNQGSISEAEAQLIDLVLAKVVGEDDTETRGTTQSPLNPNYWTKRTMYRNELRAEQRDRLYKKEPTTISTPQIGELTCGCSPY